jgi:hypothetical protein
LTAGCWTTPTTVSWCTGGWSAAVTIEKQQHEQNEGGQKLCGQLSADSPRTRRGQVADKTRTVRGLSRREERRGEEKRGKEKREEILR